MTTGVTIGGEDNQYLESLLYWLDGVIIEIERPEPSDTNEQEE